MDGANVAEFSQHAQVWAVLAGAVSGDKATSLMQRTLSAKPSTLRERGMAQVSYAMSFYLFRALEKAGLYDETVHLWQPWKELANLNLTTWVEDPVTQRSDCHGWGALPLYEFTASILGVRPGEQGYGKIFIRPRPLPGLDWARGTAATPHGPVSVAWTRGHTGLDVDVKAPPNCTCVLSLPDGKLIEKQGNFSGRTE